RDRRRADRTDHSGHGERPGAARLPLPQDRRAAGEARLQEQPQVRFVLICYGQRSPRSGKNSRQGFWAKPSLRALAFLALASALGAPDAARAQGRPQSAPWIQLAIVQVDPAMVDEYAGVQRELAARVKRGGTPWRTVCRTDVFGDTYRFLIAT